MIKENKIALLYSFVTLFLTFIVGQVLLILYPNGNTIGSSVLFILINSLPMIVAIVFSKYEKKKKLLKDMFFKKRKNHSLYYSNMQCYSILWSIIFIKKY